MKKRLPFWLRNQNIVKYQVPLLFDTSNMHFSTTNRSLTATIESWQTYNDSHFLDCPPFYIQIALLISEKRTNAGKKRSRITIVIRKLSPIDLPKSPKSTLTFRKQQFIADRIEIYLKTSERTFSIKQPLSSIPCDLPSLALSPAHGIYKLLFIGSSFILCLILLLFFLLWRAMETSHVLSVRK